MTRFGVPEEGLEPSRLGIQARPPWAALIVEVLRLTHEAHDLDLPVEPGVRDGRDALVRWAVLLEEVIP